MDNVLEVLRAVLPVMIAIALGYMARKLKIITPKGIAGIKQFVLRFTLPMLIFKACYMANLNADSILVVVCIFCTVLLAVFLGKLLLRITNYKRTILPYFTSGTEMGMFGYALYTSLFGIENLGNMAIIDLGNMLGSNVLRFPGLIIRQAMLSNKGKAPCKKKIVLTVLKNPILVAFVIGFVCLATGFSDWIEASQAGKAFEAVVNFISGPTGMTILFVVGYGMEFSKANLKDALKSCAMRALVMTILGITTITIIDHFGNVDALMRWALILTYTLPSSFVLPLFAVEEEIEYVSTCVSLYAVFSLIAYVIITILVLGV